MSAVTERNLTNQDRGWKSVELVPQRSAWATMIAGAIVPLGLAVAAVLATRFAESDRVAMMAWIAVAVVGTASVISAAAASRRRSVEHQEVEDHSRDVDRSRTPSS